MAGKNGGEIAVGGMPFLLCIHFVRNRGAALFSSEIAAMFRIEQRYVHSRMKRARETGWFSTHIKQRDDGRSELLYFAGPRLEQL